MPRTPNSKAGRRVATPSPERRGAPKKMRVDDKQVSPLATQTGTARSARAWQVTALRWRDQLSSRAGEIISFAARKVLLLAILYTMELPAIKGVLQFGHAAAHLGVKGMGAAFALVHTMTNVSVTALRVLWNSTSESEEDGRVYIAQPQHHRRADPNLDKKNLRKITTPHLRAIDAYIEWANRFYGQVTPPLRHSPMSSTPLSPP